MHEKLSDLRTTFDIEGPLFQNKKSRVLHHPGKSPASCFSSFFKWPRCAGKCFKGEVLANASQAADLLDALASKRKKSDSAD